MSGWNIQIGDDPLNLVAAMNCTTVMTAVQSALMATGTPWEQALDVAEEAWLAVGEGHGGWNTRMLNGVLLKVTALAVLRTERNGNGEVRA